MIDVTADEASKEGPLRSLFLNICGSLPLLSRTFRLFQLLLCNAPAYQLAKVVSCEPHTEACLLGAIMTLNAGGNLSLDDVESSPVVHLMVVVRKTSALARIKACTSHYRAHSTVPMRD